MESAFKPSWPSPRALALNHPIHACSRKWLQTCMFTYERVGVLFLWKWCLPLFSLCQPHWRLLMPSPPPHLLKHSLPLVSVTHSLGLLFLSGYFPLMLLSSFVLGVPSPPAPSCPSPPPPSNPKCVHWDGSPLILTQVALSAASVWSNILCEPSLSSCRLTGDSGAATHKTTICVWVKMEMILQHPGHFCMK